jgi:hypothetical protein
MKKRISVLIALAMLLLVVVPAQAAPSAAKSTTIISVEKNEYVVVQLENFPSNSTYHVRMNVNGTYGINGYLASKVTTNSGGTFIAKFPIPEELANEDIISIRFEDVEGDNDPPYNFFYNEDAAFNYSASGSGDTTYNNWDYGEPQFDILKVNKSVSMVAKTNYFPPGDRWAVFMKDGALDSEELYDINGFDASEGGIYEMTLTIPSALQYSEKIAVIFYNINDGYRTYDLIWNRDCTYPNCDYDG